MHTLVLITNQHKEFESKIYPVVSKDRNNHVIFSGLPKIYVDYLDFEKCENFESLENNIITKIEKEFDLKELKYLKTGVVDSYQKTIEYIKNQQ